jgi:catechol 2,3-dioxygenase-like lactoylglutathione lyase family enzyme
MTDPNSDISFIAAVPQFTVPDLVRTAEYYRDVLGFEIAGYFRTPPVFAIVTRGPVQFFFNRADHSSMRTGRAEGAYDAYIHLRGVDALEAELRNRGAVIIEGLSNRVYGQREFVIRDVNGLIIAFGEDISEKHG